MEQPLARLDIGADDVVVGVSIVVFVVSLFAAWAYGSPSAPDETISSSEPVTTTTTTAVASATTTTPDAATTVPAPPDTVPVDQPPPG